MTIPFEKLEVWYLREMNILNECHLQCLWSRKKEREKYKNETVACGKSQAHRTKRRLWNVSIEIA